MKIPQILTLIHSFGNGYIRGLSYIWIQLFKFFKVNFKEPICRF